VETTVESRDRCRVEAATAVETAAAVEATTAATVTAAARECGRRSRQQRNPEHSRQKPFHDSILRLFR